MKYPLINVTTKWIYGKTLQSKVYTRHDNFTWTQFVMFLTFCKSGFRELLTFRRESGKRDPGRDQRGSQKWGSQGVRESGRGVASTGDCISPFPQLGFTCSCWCTQQLQWAEYSTLHACMVLQATYGPAILTRVVMTMETRRGRPRW